MKNNVIIKPIISEKSTKEAAKSKFTFRVASHADKKAIKKAVEEQFKVSVLGISTSLVKGKRKRVGTRRTEVMGSSWKKATVTILAGQKIDWFDVGGVAK